MSSNKGPPVRVKRQTRYPLESFDPRYGEALKRALLSPQTIQFATHGELIQFRQRLHTYRARLRDRFPGTDEVKMIYRIRTTMDEAALTLRLALADEMFDSHLSQFPMTGPPLGSGNSLSSLDDKLIVPDAPDTDNTSSSSPLPDFNPFHPVDSPISAADLLRDLEIIHTTEGDDLP